jgi:fumarate hydratase class II
MVTSLVPLIGYEKAAALAKQSVETGKTVRELCAENLAELGLTSEQLAAALDPATMAGE